MFFSFIFFWEYLNVIGVEVVNVFLVVDIELGVVVVLWENVDKVGVEVFIGVGVIVFKYSVEEICFWCVWFLRCIEVIGVIIGGEGE